MSDHHPHRSILYIPGSNPRALEKAKGLAADGIIFDLEDAVAIDAKSQARAALANTLSAGGYGARVKLVRINALDTPWGADDLGAMSDAGADAILLPKVGSAAMVARLADAMDRHSGLSDTAIWAMIESPDGVLNAAAIANAPRMAGFVMGTNDLAKDLGAQVDAGRSQLQAALQIAVLAARSAGIVAVDGVYNAFRDEDGLIAECRQGRALGFDGKSLIHPAQLGPTNEIFAPSAEDIALARRQIEAFEAAEATGQGVAVLDGSIVENLHVATARKIIAADAAIRALAD